jgi:hypothetical protein
MHASLLLQKMGLSVMLSPRSIMYTEEAEAQYDINAVPQGPPPKFFEAHKWAGWAGRGRGGAGGGGGCVC